jgi:hypothetical protein
LRLRPALGILSFGHNQPYQLIRIRGLAELRQQQPPAMHGANTGAFALSSDNILEAFLQDMSALDQQQLSLPTETKVSVPLLPKPANVVQAPVSTSNKKRRTPSWLKRKRELQALREQSEALETRVEFLRREREGAKETCAKETLEQVKWQKAACDVEKQRCQDAQEENLSLKEQLQAYASLSGGVQAALATICRRVAAARTLRVEIGAGKNLRLASPGVFDMLERRLDAQFRALEAVGRFDELRPRMPSIDTDGYYKSGDRSKGTVELKRVQLLPFEQNAISSTILSIVELGRFPGDQVSRVLKRSNDSYAMDSSLTVRLEDGEGSLTLDMHCVMKRFVTPNGSVLLMEARSDWTADVEPSRAWCHTTEEAGCFSVSKYAVEGSHETSAMSQIQSTMTLRPREPSTVATRYPLAGARTIIDVVIPSFREIVKSRHQCVENTLFDCLRGGRTREALA